MRYFLIILGVLLYLWCIGEAFAHISVYLAYLLVIVGVGIIIYLTERKIKQKKKLLKKNKNNSKDKIAKD